MTRLPAAGAGEVGCLCLGKSQEKGLASLGKILTKSRKRRFRFPSNRRVTTKQSRANSCGKGKKCLGAQRILDNRGRLSARGGEDRSSFPVS